MTAPRRRLLVATGSAHKLIELQRLFGDLPIDLVTLRDLGITDEARKTAAVLGYNYPNSSWYKDSYKLFGGAPNATEPPPKQDPTFYDKTLGRIF